MPSAPAEEPRAWLVFRLGPHLMCASALDVEGIISPVKPRPVPFSPPHMLGWFDFRGRVAAVISLRTKFDVGTGSDSDAGPYVVAQVKGDLAAFWVDEVRDVLESHDANWQAMPGMPGAAAFDCYTIRNDEVVLRTSFENLLRADSVAAFDRAPAAPAPEPVPAAVEPDEPAAAPPAAAPSSAAIAPESGIEEAAPVPPSPRQAPEAPAPSVAPAPEASTSRPDPAPARPRYSDPLRESPAPASRRPDPPPAPRSRAEATPPPTREPARSRRPATPPQEIPPPTARRAHDDDVPPGMDSIPAEEPPSARRTGWIAALAALTVLIIGAGTFWWWPAAPSAPAETPVATGPISSSPPRVRAEREPAPTAEAPRVETPPETPMAKLASPAQAPAPPPGSTRVLTLEAREFRLTVDRPAKPAPAAASPPAADASRITYIVVRGDTLGHIAHRFLGDAARYPELAQLSRIRNPHLIYPGDLVTIDKIRPRP